MSSSTDPSKISSIRKIDNSRVLLPLATTLLIILLAVIFVWFFRGGSFKLYASVFFFLYSLTKQIWVSVILIGIIQNIIFLPLRFIGLQLSTRLKNFEDEIEQTEENQQYLLLNKKVKEGDPSVIFYIFNFVVNAIAFFSAGRIFLIDFYTQPLDQSLLYSFVPYPQYPLQGTDFHFPFFEVTQTMALSWATISKFWLIILAVTVIPRFLWRLIKFIFWRNKQILQARINYNNLLYWVSGFGGTLFVLSLLIFRHIPTQLTYTTFVADLTRQNSTMNFITAFGTFITVLHAGYVTAKIITQKATAAGTPKKSINRIFKSTMRSSFKNALLLGVGAFLVTNQIPCAFELSVATFEILYMISPLTFDRLIPSPKPKQITQNSMDSAQPPTN